MIAVEQQNAILAEQAQIYKDSAAEQRVASIQQALDAFNSAKSVAQRMRTASELMARAAEIRAEEQDDEEALLLLLS